MGGFKSGGKSDGNGAKAQKPEPGDVPKATRCLEPKTEPPMSSGRTKDRRGERPEVDLGGCRSPTDEEVRSVSDMLTEMYENPNQREARLAGYKQN